MFKTRKSIFFLIILIIVSVASIGLSLFSYFYVGNKVEYKNDENILNDSMKLGYKFDISDIKKDKNYKNNWIDSNVTIKTYIYTDSNDLSKVIESSEVISYDNEAKKFSVEGIGSGYIEVIDQFDSTITVKFPYKTSFKSNDTLKIINDNNFGYNDDNYITKAEINSIKKITISDFDDYDLIDLKNIYLTNKNNVLNIENKPNCNYFVNPDLYSSYLSNNEWSEYKNNIYPYLSDDINKVTVLYMFDGGKLENNEDLNSYSMSLEINSKNEKINDITPSKKGYLFDGWYIYENDKATDKKIDNDYIYDSNIKLIAKWNEIKYTIKYNSSKQTTLPNESILSYKQNSKISDMILQFERYTFIGWSLESEAKTVDYNANDDISMLSDKDGDVINLYAVWSANSYSIVFDSNGSNDLFSPINNIKADEDVTIPNNKPKKDGYTFIGWDINKNSIAPQFLADQDNVCKNLATSDSDSVILYAIYIPNNYIVNFDANGGTGAPNPINCSYGSTNTIPTAEPKKSKMVFLGWNTDKNATTAKYKSGDTLKNLTTSDSITLYAIYEYDTFRIKYYGDSSVSNLPSSSSSIKYDQASYLISSVVPTKTGYLFVGWSKTSDSNASVDYTSGYKLESADIHELYDLSTNNVVTLYSVFKKIYSFKLFYKDKDDTGATVKFNADVTDSYGTVYKKDTTLKYNEDTGKVYYFDEGTKITLYAKFDGNGAKKYIIDGGSEKSSDKSEITLSFEFNKNHTLKIDSWNNCIVNGTLIMMADGTNKKVEDILPTDKILSLNHHTGVVEEAVGFMIERSSMNLMDIKTLTLYFEDDNQITIADCHRFFDTTLMKYIEINYDNVSDYVGHKFLTIRYDGGNFKYKEEQLMKFEFKDETVYVYSPLSYININIISNNILSAAGGRLEALFNYFDYDSNYKYDDGLYSKDIEEYGLFTYDELMEYIPNEIKEYVTEDLFYMFNGQYFKVVIGKGIATMDDIINMIDEYIVNFTGDISINE